MTGLEEWNWPLARGPTNRGAEVVGQSSHLASPRCALSFCGVSIFNFIPLRKVTYLLKLGCPGVCELGAAVVGCLQRPLRIPLPVARLLSQRPEQSSPRLRLSPYISDSCKATGATGRANAGGNDL